MAEVPFCPDPFWSDFSLLENATSSQSLPLPTECFSHTVLALTPCFFFFLLLPVAVLQIKLSRQPPLPWTMLQSAKWLLTGILILDRVFVLLVALYQRLFTSEVVPTIDFVYPIIVAVTMLCSLFAMNEYRRAGFYTSGFLFLTWMLFAVFGAPEFYTWLQIGTDPHLVVQVEFYRYLAYLVYYPLVVLLWILLFFADPLTIFSKDSNCPEMEASFVNDQTLWWFGNIVSKGNKKPLEIDDLYELDPELESKRVADEFRGEWSKSIKAYNQEKKRSATTGSYILEDEPLLAKASKGYGAVSDNNRKTEEVRPPSIYKVLWKLHKWELLGGSGIKLISDLLNFANPGFLSLLISFTENPNAAWWEGYFYAGGIFLAGTLRSLLQNAYFTQMYKVGTKIQSALTALVYEKTLRLSNAARREKTQGEIVNLMAIDVDRFRLITPQLQQYWSSPLQITISMVLLWQTIGPATIAGFFVMVAIIPINICVVSKFSKKWQIEMMRLKDERIKLTNEVLSGIKVVKLYAWEPAMEHAIDKIRRREMHLVKMSAVVKTFADMLNIAAPFFVALVTFTTFTLSSPLNVLTPNIAFVSLTLFNQLRGPLMMAAELINQTIQLVVSNDRLKKFLVAEELKDDDIDKQDDVEFYDTLVESSGATFTWERNSRPQLENIELKVPKAQLVAVVGTVGSGKSSLLSALLGEMEKLRGYVGVRGTAAYVPQQPWIQNSTLRGNIVMDRDFDKQRYEQTIDVCALKHDVALLPAGDSTEIGEKGINLSGGQKARVALARAVYQDRDLYLLDDPLSAVDAHVARHIFDKVIGSNGVLASKTRILITHGLSFLKETDAVAVMNNGTITHIDTYDNLKDNPEVADILREVEVEKHDEEESETPSPTESIGSDEHIADNEMELDGDALSVLSRKSSRVSKTRPSVSRQSSRMSRTSKKGEPVVLAQPLITKEGAESGRVKSVVYLDYFKSMGLVRYVIPFIATLLLNSFFNIARSLWLTDWSNDNVIGADASQAKPVGIRLGMYAFLGTSEVVFLFVSLATVIIGGVQASIRLHRPLLHNIFRSPLSFFDVTPLGRILNRLGKDMETIDLRLSANVRFSAISFVNVLQTCVVIGLSTPLFIAVAIPIFIVYFFILRYFITTSRQLQRLASVTRSPIYSHFGESIQGASTIRAFGWVPLFEKTNLEKLTTHIRCSYFSLVSNRWLSVRLEFLGNLIILATAILAVLSKNWGSMTAGVIGLSVSYSLNITFMMSMFVRTISELETNIVSVERVREYTYTPTEASWTSERSLPANWPSKGAVDLVNYSTRYRPGLDLVLKGVSLRIEAGQKVGVVGRTGAGKSSLALALFRIVEAADGSIVIDDVEVGKIGLHQLRQNLTIIPQERFPIDPVLFSGTLRFNLDPTEEYPDSEVWKALELANLGTFVSSLPKKLEHRVDEGGENISLGQRQLVCLVRALLRKSRILVLDEATAAVDTQTDNLIQATIRQQFMDSTVITIAHRLNTIIDYDKVLVMDGGKVAEFDTPQKLLDNQNSIFYSMAKSANLVQ